MKIAVMFDTESDCPFIATDPELKDVVTRTDYLKIILHRLRSGGSGLDALGFCGCIVLSAGEELAKK